MTVRGVHALGLMRWLVLMVLLGLLLGPGLSVGVLLGRMAQEDGNRQERTP